MRRLLVVLPLLLVGCLKKSTKTIKRSISTMDRFNFNRHWADVGLPPAAINTIQIDTPLCYKITSQGQSRDKIAKHYRRQLLLNGWEIIGELSAESVHTIVGRQKNQAVVISLRQLVSKKSDPLLIEVDLRKCLQPD